MPARYLNFWMGLGAQLAVVLTADCTEAYGLCALVSIFWVAASNSCWSILTTSWDLFPLPSGSIFSLTMPFHGRILCNSIQCPFVWCRRLLSTDRTLKRPMPGFNETLGAQYVHTCQFICITEGSQAAGAFHLLSQGLIFVRHDFPVYSYLVHLWAA